MFWALANLGLVAPPGGHDVHSTGPEFRGSGTVGKSRRCDWLPLVPVWSGDGDEGGTSSACPWPWSWCPCPVADRPWRDAAVPWARPVADDPISDRAPVVIQPGAGGCHACMYTVSLSLSPCLLAVCPPQLGLSDPCLGGACTYEVGMGFHAPCMPWRAWMAHGRGWMNG